jgi:hypothetical protein
MSAQSPHSQQTRLYARRRTLDIAQGVRVPPSALFGACAGVASVGIAAAIAFAVSLIPSTRWHTLLGVPGSGAPPSSRIARSITWPWAAAEMRAVWQSFDAHLTAEQSGAQLIPALCAVVAVVLVGLVCRRVAVTFAARLGALGLAAVGCGATLAITAPLLSQVRGNVDISYPVWAIAGRGMLLTLLVGTWSFGVFEVSDPRGGAAQVGWRGAIGLALASGIAAAAWIPFSPVNPTGLLETRVPRADVAVNSASHAASLGTVAVAAAFQAPVGFHTEAGAPSPLVTTVSAIRQDVRMPELDRVAARRQSLSIRDVAATVGGRGRYLLYAYAAVVVMVGLLLARSAARNASTRREALEQALICGASLAATLIVIDLVFGRSATVAGATLSERPGLLGVMAQTTGLLAISSVAAVTIRTRGGAPAASQTAAPTVPAAPAPELASVGEWTHCTHCGQADSTPGARFCSACGSPREGTS